MDKEHNEKEESRKRGERKVNKLNDRNEELSTIEATGE
jgi:hypothetical protein